MDAVLGNKRARTGGYWNNVLGPSLPPPMPSCASQSAASSSTAVFRQVASAGSAFARSVRRLKDLPWPVQADEEREHAMSMWRLVLENNYSAFRTGRLLLEEAATASDTKVISTTVTDTFEGKASKTLYKRAGSLLKYIAFCKNRVPGVQAFPVSEDKCYEYVKHLRSVGAAASVPSDFRSALAFAMGVVGLDGVKDVLESRRITGVAMSVFVKKRKLKQRKNLTVPMIKTLERLTCEAPAIQDRIGSGTFTLTMYLRSRFGDMQFIEEIEEDLYEGYGYVQCMTSRTKTGTTMEKKTKFLPMAATTVGLSGLDWVPKYLEDRATAGLQCRKGVPFLPAPRPEGGWYQRSLTASEGSEWLRNLLIDAGHDPLEVQDIGTHSLKVTPLSIACKYGLGKGVRRLLGYHVGREDWSLLTYSRDAMSEPLRQLDGVFDAIRKKQFDPDATRSGRFTAAVQPVAKVAAKKATMEVVFPLTSALDSQPTAAAELSSSLQQELSWARCDYCNADVGESNWASMCDKCCLNGCRACNPTFLQNTADGDQWHCLSCTPLPLGAALDDVSDGFGPRSEASSEPSDHDSSESDDDDDMPESLEQAEIRSIAEEIAVHQGSVRNLTRSKHAGKFMYRHDIFGTLHWNHKSSLTKLACGRNVQKGFKLLSEYPALVSPMCSQCFGNDKQFHTVDSDSGDGF